LYYTASGIITLKQVCGLKLLKYSSINMSTVRGLFSQPVHGTATYRSDDTRDCIVQFWPPNDEHLCSKHVEV